MRGLIKQNLFIQAAISILVSIAALPVFAETGSAISTERKVNAETHLEQAKNPELVVEKKPSKRLRFRDGPVCMCADGLTENDIMESQKRNKEKLKIIENNEGRQP